MSPSLDESASVGAVGSTTEGQGPWEESCQPTSRVTDLVLVVDPLGPSGCGPGAAGEHGLRHLHTDEEAFVEVKVPRGKAPAPHWSKKKKKKQLSKLGCGEEGKRSSLT